MILIFFLSNFLVRCKGKGLEWMEHGKRPVPRVKGPLDVSHVRFPMSTVLSGEEMSKMNGKQLVLLVTNKEENDLFIKILTDLLIGVTRKILVKELDIKEEEEMIKPRIFLDEIHRN